MSQIQEFDFSIDLLRSLLWRHDSAENLQQVINDKQAALDTLNQDFWNDWFEDVFNLQTANAFGLQVWSIILDLAITVDPGEPEPDNSNWGFGAFRKNFGNGNFSAAANPTVLSIEEARLALRLRYYQLITRATIPEANAVVDEIFGSLGDVYAIDGSMEIVYLFDFTPSAQIRYVLDQYDLLPRPSAVERRVEYQPNQFFGFGSFRKNFGNAGFRRGA